MKKKLVIKFGSSTLTQGKWEISREKLIDIAHQIVVLQEKFHVIIVSSGAVAAAKQHFKLKAYQSELPLKQALAAIGQPILMEIYQEIFKKSQLEVAQCLFSYTDFQNETSRQNIINTLDALIYNGFIPIINENDTVATEEITFGDNDQLAALTAGLVHADLLVLVSDIDGLYTDDPKKNPQATLINEVTELKHVTHLARDSKSDLGTGGMSSKMIAAEICQQNNVEMWIVNGKEDLFLLNAISGELDFTRFLTLKKE